jgi:hypothetical protein
MGRILSAQGRRTAVVEDTRRHFAESDASFRSRLAASIAGTNGQIAWLCIPPVPDVPLMIEAGILAGLNVVVEKPWLCSPGVTDSLVEMAQGNHVHLAVHHQYCLMERVESWRRDFHDASKLQFGGRFNISRPNRLGIPALDNLGSHLLAIREYAIPNSNLSEIKCGYGLPDERRIWIEASEGMVESIDLLANSEPLIQRFIARFEDAVLEGPEFPLDLPFALRVAGAVAALKKRRVEPSFG